MADNQQRDALQSSLPSALYDIVDDEPTRSQTTTMAENSVNGVSNPLRGDSEAGDGVADPSPPVRSAPRRSLLDMLRGTKDFLTSITTRRRSSLYQEQRADQSAAGTGSGTGTNPGDISKSKSQLLGTGNSTSNVSGILASWRQGKRTPGGKEGGDKGGADPRPDKAVQRVKEQLTWFFQWNAAGFSYFQRQQAPVAERRLQMMRESCIARLQRWLRFLAAYVVLSIVCVITCGLVRLDGRRLSGQGRVRARNVAAVTDPDDIQFLFSPEATMRQRLRAWLDDSTPGQVLDIVQVLLSLASCVMYVYTTYNPPIEGDGTLEAIEILDVVFASVFLFDYVLRYVIAYTRYPIPPYPPYSTFNMPTTLTL